MIKQLRPCMLYKEFGSVTDYQQVWRYQKVLNEHAGKERKKGNDIPDSLILVQHQSLYTLGRGATLDNLKFSPHSPDCLHSLYRVERGGEVTWHGPGQLVCYPILDLHKHKKDLHWYTQRLEQTVIDALKEIGIEGTRSKVNTGVWVGNNKICTVGVTASRWVTMHGLALNVLPDLKNFDQIIPCGVTEDGHGVCSVEGMIPNIKMDVVADALISSFSRNFDLEFESRSFSTLGGVMNAYPELSTAVIDRTI